MIETDVEITEIAEIAEVATTTEEAALAHTTMNEKTEVIEVTIPETKIEIAMNEEIILDEASNDQETMTTIIIQMTRTDPLKEED